MALVRWEPLQEFDKMRREMERMFDRVAPRITFAPRGEGMPTLFMPDIDVYTTDKEVVVTANLPGVEPNKVSVEVSEDSVSIAGSAERSEEVKDQGFCLSERQHGEFARTIVLPERIRENEAKASFKNGVLTIRAPRAEEARAEKGRKIPIEAQK